ncbi:unnamed protein product [Allacma fusca]|uniref:protein acetyllysine N-acetyltransferase n=1 Tax=Allacma fusca TaxID=39272 RepID=A0A8J2KSC6_9HEXA|nr:unnamed protein product [Allacma fusca]
MEDSESIESEETLTNCPNDMGVLEYVTTTDDEDESMKAEMDYEDSDRELATKLQKEEMNLRGGRKSERLQTKSTFCQKKHESAMIKSLVVLLKKPQDSLSKDEKEKIRQNPKLAREAKLRLQKRLTAIDRLREFEDPEDELNEKCLQLANMISNARYVVVYTGAGISTSACIPDYRGPNGIWTLLQKGQSLDSQNQVVLTTADPTPTHMSIYELYKQGIVKHIVSQNCDGLHLRSGIPKKALSEVHGNMYVEVCTKCNREYVRSFDVTQNTRRREHRTGRNCYHCGLQLKDTVVHFGEKGSLRWPLNWAGAQYHANRADFILCIGSSLKVLRRYPILWSMDKPANKRPALCIVNLQWTPKDQFAQLKIHGKCDEVMTKVMEKLEIQIPNYQRHKDAIFKLATSLHASELQSKSTAELNFPPDHNLPPKSVDLDNYIRFEPVKTLELHSLNDRPAQTALKKGNGTGWLGNAWGVKPKQKKLKRISGQNNNEESKQE